MPLVELDKNFVCPGRTGQFNSHDQYHWPDGSTTFYDRRQQSGRIVVSYANEIDPKIPHNPDAICPIEDYFERQSDKDGILFAGIECFNCQRFTGCRPLLPHEVVNLDLIEAQTE